jgi:hypothetical protein
VADSAQSVRGKNLHNPAGAAKMMAACSVDNPDLRRRSGVIKMTKPDIHAP